MCLCLNGVTQMRAVSNNAIKIKLLQTGFWRGDTHISGASKGQYKDWAYLSVEYYDDTFTDPGPWVPYKQEIISIQIVPPYTIRRLAHHRSRGTYCPSCIYEGYGTQPRPSVSWDGSKIAWASDFGYDASPAEYSDIYVAETTR